MNAEGLCNLALAKLGLSDRIASLSAPIKPLEKHFSTIYGHYRDVELRKKRWLFAKRVWTLTASGDPTTDADRPYNYEMPAEMVAPWRDKDTEWIVVGRALWSVYTPLIVAGTQRVSEASFDPLFDEVLAGRLAIESCDLPGVSDGKRADMKDWYRDALQNAGAGNAYLHEADDIADDAKFDWLTERTQV